MDLTYLDCELSLLGPESCRLILPDRDFQGRTRLSEDDLVELRALDSDAEAYGVWLFDHLLPVGGDLRLGYEAARTLARERGQKIRFRLHFSPELPTELVRLLWERLFDQVRRSPLACDPETAFSRCLSVRREMGVPTLERPRLLVAHSAPSDSELYGLSRIDRTKMEEEFDEGLAAHREQLSWEFLRPPVTPDRLRHSLLEGGFHALHLVGHGLQREDGSLLLLEDRDGRCRFVRETQVASIFLGTDQLRLVTLLSCHGAVSTGEYPLSGLAPRLVEIGVPAVIAMRDQLTLRDASEFTRHFYVNLVRHGTVDAAVNEARQRFSLAFEECEEWSDAVLFMRLRDGKLWEPPPPPPPPPRKEKSEKQSNSGPGSIIPVAIKNVEQLIHFNKAENFSISSRSSRKQR